ncbi:trypsin [Drosophila sulfurigaster albostrigata]|uniref:trypsin n=1 Tax=Drosophila sulfurigaster albostrigata TaxID=89887 RepID=UPI002D21EB34|nr:trypsin [Drosophila sulfurigaster albostrigata]
MLSLKIVLALLPLLALANAKVNSPPLGHYLAGHFDDVDASSSVSSLLEKLLLKLKEEHYEEPSARIIDGFDVQGVDNAAYLVSLSLTPLVYSHQCAGAIIGKRWVLTTAHCVEELRSFNNGIVGSAIYAGLANRSNVSNAQVRYVDFASSHRLFNGNAGSDNIALLHVTESFVYSARVQQIALPDLDEDYSGQTAIAYGWGLTDVDGDEYSKELQYAFAPLLNSTRCAELLPSDAPLTKNQVCAEIKACYGDGGTPLVYWPISGPAELVALGSWSYMPCGYASRPTVYTSVPTYVDWIYQVISAYYQLN